MLEWLLLQIIIRRFQSTRYCGCRWVVSRGAFSRITPASDPILSPITVAASFAFFAAVAPNSRALTDIRVIGPAPVFAILVKAPLNLFLGIPASISVSLLYQTDQLVLLTANPLEVIIGELPTTF